MPRTARLIVSPLASASRRRLGAASSTSVDDTSRFAYRSSTGPAVSRPRSPRRCTSPWRSRAETSREVVLFGRPTRCASSPTEGGCADSTTRTSSCAARSIAWVPEVSAISHHGTAVPPSFWRAAAGTSNPQPARRPESEHEDSGVLSLRAVAVRVGRTCMLALAIAALGLSAAHAAPSADAPWIVFSGQPDGTSVPQLFRVQTTGAGLEQITTGSLPATDPAFSPSGAQLVFSRLSSGIFRVNLDGTGLHRLTSGGRDSYPVWSPDGKRIAFVRPYRTEWRAYVMSASGSGQKLLKLAPPSGRPTWTRDGTSLFIPAAGGLVKVDSRTGGVQKVYRVVLDPSISQ